MPLRLIQARLPAEADLEELLEGRRVLAEWTDACADECSRLVQLAVPAEKSEAILDELESRFGRYEDFRLALLPVEAMIPRIEDAEEEDGEAESEEAEEPEGEPLRISRAELYEDLSDGLAVSPVFLAMAGLSAVVAAVGLLRDDLAVVIGAMVIAPLLKPNVALALSTTLGDSPLAWRALKTNAAGASLAALLAWLTGLALGVDPSVPALASRTSIGFGDLALALSAGAAGTLAFTQGLAGAVIGVMVAVALLPPLVAGGVLLGAGHTAAAAGALLLAAGNMICLNLAGIATFLLQGIRPRSWWEAERARRATWIAAAVWSALLAALVGIVVVAGGFSEP